jgi:tripartite-type tricarboxylate transporter receptor subunit TctC
VQIHMPGGGGLTALNYIANVAPKDGTVLTMLTQTIPMEQALNLNKDLDVDVRQFGWIGNMSNSNFFFLTSKKSGIQTIEDAKKREVVLAGTGSADPALYLANLFNKYLGTKFRVVFGYPGGVELTMAVVRNETDGRATSDPETMFAMVEGGASAFNVLIQVGLQKQPAYSSVPLLNELATNDEQREVFGYMSKVVSLSRVVCATPGVPPDRIALLRRAFDKALADPEFLDESKKLKLEIAAMNGDAVEHYVRDIVDAPAPLLEKVKKAITS